MHHCTKSRGMPIENSPKKYCGKPVCHMLRGNGLSGGEKKHQKPLDRSSRVTLFDHLPVAGLNLDESEALASVDSRGLLMAIEREQGSLKSLLAGALLTCFCHPKHPLVELEHHSPGWIRKLLQSISEIKRGMHPVSS